MTFKMESVTRNNPETNLRREHIPIKAKSEEVRIEGKES